MLNFILNIELVHHSHKDTLQLLAVLHRLARLPANNSRRCGDPAGSGLKRKLMSCSHGKELGQLGDLASDWLFTLV